MLYLLPGDLDSTLMYEIESILRALVGSEGKPATHVVVSRNDADFVNGFAREAASLAWAAAREPEAERFTTLEVLSARWLSDSPQSGSDK